LNKQVLLERDGATFSVAAADEAWWRGAVIYQIYPRSFADSNGDGVGDLPGITARLDHVASLGVDAIWLSPFFTSPMKDYGYDIANYRDVDPIFGTLADFDALLARAHSLGLRVIIDQVYAHTSDEHAWFQESRRSRHNPKADWFVWADAKPDGSPPNNWQSVFYGPCWTWDARRGQYYLHNFLPEQPNLNGHNPAVQDALIDTARFWLDRGVDGFRLDAINFAMHDPALTDNPPVASGVGKRSRPFDFQHHLHNQSHAAIPAFLERIQAAIDAYGGRFTVAEVGGEQADAEMKLFTQGPRLDSAYGFNFLYADRVTPELIHQSMALWPGDPGEGWPSWAFSNHDAPRVVSRWREDRDAAGFACQAMLLLMSLRGNVFLYQGEELGLPQADVPFERLRDPEAIANWPATQGRDGARTPLPWSADAPNAGFSDAEPWLPVDPAHLPLAVDRQEADPHSTLNLTRRLIALRKRLPALRTGAIRPVDTPAPLLAFERGDGATRLLCVFNLGSEPVDWPLPSGWRIIERCGEPFAPLSGLIAERMS
jgi:alpha-glucosidase